MSTKGHRRSDAARQHMSDGQRRRRAREAALKMASAMRTQPTGGPQAAIDGDDLVLTWTVRVPLSKLRAKYRPEMGLHRMRGE